eukprot:TRINITY_DN9192_c0_g1_i1.p1 TRINITY_DN9192_c0_g1~~TRINITY_DN9192_c0_g1_i1.p1  ORF type:complete len:516 (+),score=131.66 TRINITY_DN9192_c0_g1_i1:119-1666(+)
MVVLAAALFTKNGKPLVSRQFVDISRARIEGLLAAFPKLMGTGKQHTFIETENVRYVYQPLENLYMLILTNKGSNILEDLETLHILAKLVPEISKSLDEREIIDKAFDLVFAFDEVIALGYKERVTLNQINTFLRMESQEELIHIMVQENRERIAREEANKRIAQMDRLRAERGKQSPGISYIPTQGIGSRGSPSGERSVSSEYGPADPFVIREESKSRYDSPPAQSESRGMQLKPKEATSQFLRAVAKEDHNVNVAPTKGGSSATVHKDPVVVELIEVVTAALSNDGTLNGSLQVQGVLSLMINDPKFAGVNFRFINFNDPNYVFRPHPNINKARFSKEGVVALKADNKNFPVGNALNILKWRFQTSNESKVPITVSCWPTDEGDGVTAVTLEYEFKEQNDGFALGDVCISIPIVGSQPEIAEVEGGICEFDVRNHALNWKIDLVDAENSSGSMEFRIPSGGDASGLFPIKISFISTSSFCPIELEEVVQKTGESVPYAFVKNLQTEDYVVNNK